MEMNKEKRKSVEEMILELNEHVDDEGNVNKEYLKLTENICGDLGITFEIDKLRTEFNDKFKKFEKIKRN